MDLEYLDWWTKYYASLGDKYRNNYEIDDIEDQDQDLNQDSEKKRSVSLFKQKSKF